MIHYGEIPEGLCVCHKCDIRNCVNPKCLFLGTKKDNMDDMVSKGRQSRLQGESHPRSVLRESEVVLIKRLLNRYSGGKKGIGRGIQRFLSRWFGVEKTTIRSIHNGTNWRHIK